MINTIPIVFVYDNSIVARDRAHSFLKYLDYLHIDYKAKHLNISEITFGGNYVCFMSEVIFRKWCIGRTYVIDGCLCRSGERIRC